MRSPACSSKTCISTSMLPTEDGSVGTITYSQVSNGDNCPPPRALIDIRADQIPPQPPRSLARSFAQLGTARAFEATRPTSQTTTLSRLRFQSLTPNTATLPMSLTILPHYPRTSRPRAFQLDSLSTRAVWPCQVRELSGYVSLSPAALHCLTRCFLGG